MPKISDFTISFHKAKIKIRNPFVFDTDTKRGSALCCTSSSLLCILTQDLLEFSQLFFCLRA